MKIYRPLWSEGVLLAPQQFQQQSEWESFSRAGLSTLIGAFSWGVERVEFNEALLTSGRIQVQTLRLWLPDGTLIDTQSSDLPPEPREVALPASGGADSVTVLVALPVMQPGIVNVQTETVPAERPLRYREEWVSGLHDTWLILGGRSFEIEQLAEKPESLSIRITGTNGQLPRKSLESTLLDRVVKAGKVPVKVLNLNAPTLPLYPPAGDRFHWRVMSHLGSSFLSMMDNPEVLRGTLALYDWSDDEMNRRRLEAIVAVKHTLIRRFERGYMLRGVDIEITLNSDNFAGEGDVNLFGEMLHRFFALYADVHLFNQLTLVLQPTGKRLRWKENHSQHAPG